MSARDRTVIAKLARASKGGLISIPAAAKTVGMSQREAASRLAALARRGWLERARRGLYLVRPIEAEPGQRSIAEDPWVLAREVFSPCYIGGWSAAEHWGFTEQIFRSTFVVTAAAVRTTKVDMLGNEFRVFKVPRSRLSAGVSTVWRGAERVSVSGPERTLVDCFRSPELCGGTRHLAQIFGAYGESADHDFDRLAGIAESVASGAAWKRLGYLAELVWPAEHKLIGTARRHLTAGNARLDPAVHRPGKLLKRWRLWVNADLGEFAHAERPA